jgi:flagellar M-ring protein FliF
VKKILASEDFANLASSSPVPALEDANAKPASNQALVPGATAAQWLDVAQVQGQVHAQSVHRVGELAERNPNETVAIVRQWLSETPTS